ncbi:DUF1501 domain-containing protein [Aquincola sp. S2]|uniref:DUF1501 domain-containing protein n=1 Tax=Pseudaquabacterium terrae TaxID=2732868 RepID=A0ABX2EH32_9BURK|nr:DUF1501 domain-containing protein [Aquabacterium terrae]NRF67918.1 DUF1501 domain-containing protein [Aquabacterium terrae]
MIQRRTVLQAAALAAATPFAPLSVLAQTTGGSGYRALVCLFMFGGNDANNLLVPTDDTRYGQYQRARPNLALSRNALVPLAPGGTPNGYGLHPAMAPMKPLFDAGQAALVANVGPLMAPTTKQQMQSRSVPLPINLYSHSDQQAAWQSALVDAPARNGWGGRLLERLVASGTQNRGYCAVSVAGGNLWETGDRGLSPYRVSSSGDFGFDFYDPAGTDALSVAINGVLGEARSDPFEQTWLNLMGRSIENQRVLSGALDAAALTTTFPNTGLGRQLQMAARLIGARGALGLSRQCFFASIGGFDTHGDDQLQRQNELLGEIAGAVAAFHAATVELGVAREVTLFTGSDFGRTFASNGAGSDHGWGAHQWAVGGAVRGGRIVGRFQELAIGGPDDVGQGVWIPSVALDQLGGELARWFGADTALIDEVFPRLRYFDRELGLMNFA